MVKKSQPKKFLFVLILAILAILSILSTLIHQPGGRLAIAPQVSASITESQILLTNKTTKGVACEVICNGVCPVPPAGWTLSQSNGESGTITREHSWTSDSGRCGHYSEPSGISVGQETMCCYFQE